MVVARIVNTRIGIITRGQLHHVRVQVFFKDHRSPLLGDNVGHVLNEWIQGVCRCAGVASWEKLPGQLVRIIECDGLGPTIIGHVSDSATMFNAAEWDDWGRGPSDDLGLGSAGDRAR
jgi:hypothetical protein